MKKSLIFSMLVFILAWTLTLPAYALSLKGIGKDIAKAGIEVGSNNKLRQESGKCTYASNTAIQPTGCNIRAFVAALSAFKKIAEKNSATIHDVDIEITTKAPDRAIAKKRAEWFYDELARNGVGWWDKSVYYNKGPSSVLIQVKVR